MSPPAPGDVVGGLPLGRVDGEEALADQLRHLRCGAPGPAELAGRQLAADNPALAQSAGMADLFVRLEQEATA